MAKVFPACERAPRSWASSRLQHAQATLLDSRSTWRRKRGREGSTKSTGNWRPLSDSEVVFGGSLQRDGGVKFGDYDWISGGIMIYFCKFGFRSAGI